MKTNKKTPISSTLQGGEIEALGSTYIEQHNDRITRLASLKHRAKQQENYLWSIAEMGKHAQLSKDDAVIARKAAHKLSECGNFLFFKNYYTLGEVKLTKMIVCSQHLLCPFCAAVRASRSIERNAPKVEKVLSENKKLKPVLLTLTVANGSDLAERHAHLMSCFRVLLQRNRDYIKKGRGFNEFCKLKGGFYSYENTYNEQTGEWHPHLHIFGVLEQWIDQEKLSKTWHEITNDSFIVDIRRVKRHKELGYGKAIAEVCKYALKFGDLSVQRTWQAFMVLKGSRKTALRLSGSWGVLNGLKIEKAQADTDNYQGLPYLEMLYKFVFSSSSFYDLVAVKNIETQAQANKPRTMMTRGRGQTEDEAGGVVQGAKNGGAGRTVFEGSQSIGVDTLRYFKTKAHWQVSPSVRARTRTLIRRWDGFLYNVDLFPFVERRLLLFVDS